MTIQVKLNLNFKRSWSQIADRSDFSSSYLISNLSNPLKSSFMRVGDTRLLSDKNGKKSFCF